MKPGNHRLQKTILLALLILALTATAASWWNQSWDYRKAINITEESGNTLQDYQVKLSLNTETPIIEGKMKDDCGDLRFVNSTGHQLDYWIRSGCNTSQTEIFVRMNSLFSSSTEKIFMYYGNPSAQSESNPEDTMYIYDLHGSGYDGTLYGSANYHSGSEFIELTDTANSERGSIRYSKGTPSPGFYAEWEWYTGDGSGADSNNLVTWSNGNRFEHEDPNSNGVHYFLNDHDDCNGVTWSTQCGDIESWSENPAKSSWEQARAYGVRNGDTLEYYFNTIGNTVQGSWTNSNFPPGDQFGWSGRTGGSTNHHWVRRMTVRKYTLPAPQIKVGKEKKLNLCDRRSKEGECILDSERSYSGKEFGVDSVFLSTSDVVFTSSGDETLVKVSNSSTISGTWRGNLNISARSLKIKPRAEFGPSRRIVLDER